MTYDYKYVPASKQIIGKPGTNPKQQYIGLFQKTVEEQFYNASNWWTVCEEKTIGSREYDEIDVRLTHVINAETGLKLGDDWKTVLFKEINHSIEMGRFYIFDNNTWITTNSEIVKNLTGACTIRRCNNTLRWIDEETGIYFEEPCAIEYLVKEPRNYATQGSPFITPGGFLHIETQLNARTAYIKENKRFLFGNQGHWTCYKILGTGINDFKNTETYNNDSAKILTLDLIADYVNNELDDVVNGIADFYTNSYTITLNMDSISGSVGGSFQLSANVIYNNNTVERDLDWASSDNTSASVSGSGLVSFLANGSAIITAGTLSGVVSASCVVTVEDSPEVNEEIVITPNLNYVLESGSRVYSVYLYENGIQQADIFTITCNGSNVPATSYTFSQNTNNSFVINNLLRDVDSHLVITCATGSPVITNTKDFIVYLRGAWLHGNA